MTLPLRVQLQLQRGVLHLSKLKLVGNSRKLSPIKSFELYLPFLKGKHGLEIGGPTGIFREGDILPVYAHVEALDNCDFFSSTVWAQHSESYNFNPKKAPGKTIFRDGSALVDIPDSAYDVLLSSHNLEHFANPVKALHEWRRVLKPDGALVLVLPYYKATFDHRRQPTRVDHMFHDFEMRTGEDDMTHLEEILARHDFSKDAGAGTVDEFRERCQNNFANRCLHHHVFDEHNSRELLTRAGYEVLALDFRLPSHLCILARVTSS